jgi:hypothetical protein
MKNLYEQLKPEVSGGAGKTAQFITQFGIPGLGTASLLSKLGKTKAILGAAAVDGPAVAAKRWPGDQLESAGQQHRAGVLLWLEPR